VDTFRLGRKEGTLPGSHTPCPEEFRRRIDRPSDGLTGEEKEGAGAMVRKPKTIDEYLAALSDDKRAALEKLRRTIRAAAPKAKECISYQIPAFRHNGMLVGFGATAKHCAFYPMSSTTVEAHKNELKDYDTSKAAIRFQADKPLPAALVRKLVKARIVENEKGKNK
jgi:uncharacterized protein YdhG (YjbR/CyaY superfamily)